MTAKDRHALDPRASATLTDATLSGGGDLTALQPACAGHPEPDIFHPEGNYGIAKAKANRAIAVCATCPVRRECLEVGVRSEATVGVWGGIWFGQKFGAA